MEEGDSFNYYWIVVIGENIFIKWEYKLRDDIRYEEYWYIKRVEIDKDWGCREEDYVVIDII